MLMFMATLVFLIELVLIASGLLALNAANKENSELVKWAGWILTFGGILAIICTTYFSLKYMGQGAFNLS